MTFRNMADGHRTRGRPPVTPPVVDPPGGDGNAALYQFMQQMQQQQNQFMQNMVHEMHGNHNPLAVVPEVVGGTFRDFFRMKPQEFHGGLDPVKAHE